MAEYIEREEAINAVLSCFGVEDSIFSDATVMAIGFKLKDIPAEDVQPVKWIPVTERLPEERINPNTRDFEYVLCATIWGDVRPFKYGTPIGQKEAHFWNGAGYVDAYVTHWMPIPEPPKDGET